MNIIINPGTGPVDGRPNLKKAWTAIRKFRRDLILDDVSIVRKPKLDDKEGRYAFELRLGKRRVQVDMPGLPIKNVRYLGHSHQNVWVFPRLYVDGSSWLWMFAVDWARDTLTGRWDGT